MRGRASLPLPVSLALALVAGGCPEGGDGDPLPGTADALAGDTAVVVDIAADVVAPDAADTGATLDVAAAPDDLDTAETWDPDADPADAAGPAWDDVGWPVPGGLVGGVRVSELRLDHNGTDHPWVLVFGLFAQPFEPHVWPEWSGGFDGLLWEVSQVSGPCVWISEIPAGPCEPWCSVGQTCTPEGVCEDIPDRASAGTLTFGGLTIPLAMEPNDIDLYNLLTALPDDLYAPNTVVAVTADGDELPAFDLQVRTVEPMEPAVAFSIATDMVPGQDAVLTWQPGDGTARVRWEMHTILHAGNGPSLLCETDDTGTLVVPAEMVDRFLSYAGPAPSCALSRFRRAFVDVGQGRRVYLEVTSSRGCP